MVAGAGLLETLEVLGELLLGEERRAVDAREHLTLGVATPVGAGRGQQLDGLDALRARPVRTAAEVGERAVGVEADRRQRRVGVGVVHQVLDELDLVVLLLGLEALERRLDADVLALEVLVGVDVLAHLLLDAIEVRVGDGHTLGELEVVVEAVLDRRADRDLHAGIELHHRGGEHVGGVVADDVQRVRALGRDDLQRRTGHERACEVAHLAVLAHGERGAGEAGADRRGGVGAGGAVGERELRAIGKGDVHGLIVTAPARSLFCAAPAPEVIGRCHSDDGPLVAAVRSQPARTRPR